MACFRRGSGNTSFVRTRPVAEDGSFATSDYRSMIDEVCYRVPAKRVIHIHTGDWDELLAAAETCGCPKCRLTSNDTASGTHRLRCGLPIAWLVAPKRDEHRIPLL